jgi:hypothetical protein
VASLPSDVQVKFSPAQLVSRMESGRALLVIADIGGYAEYMGSHRMSLADAEVNTSRLLERCARRTFSGIRCPPSDLSFG